MLFLTANREEMNISSEIFPTNFSNDLFYNYTEVENNFSTIPVLFFSVLLVFPMNSYVIWLIATGTGNGLAAEFFSLNLAVCEIILCVESVFIFLSYELKILRIVVSVLDGLANGRPLFQCLICVERYLAVVHPVTFLKYKPLRYRVICSVITWLASFGSSGINIYFFLMSQPMVYFVFLFVHFFLFLFIQLFCCVAVLRALKQSGPGERRREREEENHMKRRAFYVILITTVTMLILYAPYIIVLTLFRLADSAETVFSIILVCFSLAGLVQPLLILYRVRKLPFIKYH